jgi:hypothetical protein
LDIRNRGQIIKTLVIALLGLYLTTASAANVNYRTIFGQCPSRSAGTFAIKLAKIFEEKQSLRALKMTIIKDKLAEKNFISEYSINHNPFTRELEFKLNCPKPLMKVQVYQGAGYEYYDAILADNGELLDPTYEVLLRKENKLTFDLPHLALPVGEMEKEVQKNIATLVTMMNEDFKRYLSEIVVNNEKEMTMILSVDGHASTVFMGNALWEEKLVKLKKIIDYMSEKNRMPSIINLSNNKKVVVKFSDKS